MHRNNACIFKIDRIIINFSKSIYIYAKNYLHKTEIDRIIRVYESRRIITRETLDPTCICFFNVVTVVHTLVNAKRKAL